MKVAVVVPTNREPQLRHFLNAFEDQFEKHNALVIVVEDHDYMEFMLPEKSRLIHVTRDSMRNELGVKADCIGINGAAIRSYGWMVAKQEGAEAIINLDDDLVPWKDHDVIAGHIAALERQWPVQWFHTMPFPVRGTPYHLAQKSTMMNHGLWTGDYDFDAYQRLVASVEGNVAWDDTTAKTELIGKGLAFPMCGMNLSFRIEAAPYVWQPVLPDGMKRYDDIWSGLIFKRVADLADWNVTSGTPLVYHERASNLVRCLRQEMLGFGIHEELWKIVQRNGQRGELPRGNFLEIWYALASKFPALQLTAVNALHWITSWEKTDA